MTHDGSRSIIGPEHRPTGIMVPTNLLHWLLVDQTPPGRSLHIFKSLNYPSLLLSLGLPWASTAFIWAFGDLRMFGSSRATTPLPRLHYLLLT